MGSKHHKKAIQSLKQRIDEHMEKISSEEAKDFPDEGLVYHWRKEILAFEKGIRKAIKRLGK
ncbi:MAG TPA: hypothetical protein V6D13_12680 [Halomicronema sp.]